tara:strand:- start:1002 stop:1445 length:444 start_codon:yes stop_codon:yes gene_type:complete
MKNFFKLFLVFIVSFGVFYYIFSFLFGGVIKSSNTVGDWRHEVSQNMSGSEISMNTKLTVIRIEAGVYEYKLTTIVKDEMSNGDRVESYSGDFEENIVDYKWRFSGGDFGSRGAYIEVPKDKWDDYKPETLTVSFDMNRGDSMTFSR